MERFSALIGFVVILGIAFLLSNNKRAIRWRTVRWGLALQIVIAIAVLKGEWIAQKLAPIALPLERYGAALVFILLAIVVYQIAIRLPLALRRPIWYAFGVASLYLFLSFNLLAYMFEKLKEVVNNLIGYTSEGSKFVFGPLGDPKVAFIDEPAGIDSASADLWAEYGGALQVDGATRRRAIPHLLAMARRRLVTAVLAGFGRTISEVGAILIVGGNIAGYTRTMTTTIVLETSKGNLSMALGLGFVLIGISVAVSATIFALGAGEEQ